MDAYESLGVIGEGTYGVVIKARHKSSGHLVAIKRFKEGEEDEQTRKTSLREVRVLKQLRHDNVVTLLDVFRRKGKLHLVFEFIEEGTILEVLEQKGGAACGSRGNGFFDRGLCEMDVKKIMYQLLKGLQYCHGQNIVHRDVKPENILVSKEGAVKLCDFGFARSMGNAASDATPPNLPSSAAAQGGGPMYNTSGVGVQNGGLGNAGNKFTEYVATRWYRAPELLVGDVDYGKGVDVWAVGCILAEISNSLPLFPGESDLDQLAHILRCNGPMPNRFVQCFLRNPLYRNVEVPPMKIQEPLPDRFPTAPKSWLHFIVSCLKNDPADRATCSYLLSESNPFPFFSVEEGSGSGAAMVRPIGISRQVGAVFDRPAYDAELGKLFAKEAAERNRMFGRASPTHSDTGKVSKSESSKSGKPKKEKRSKSGIDESDVHVSRKSSNVEVEPLPPTPTPSNNNHAVPSNTNNNLWSQYVASAAHELPELGGPSGESKYRSSHLPPSHHTPTLEPSQPPHVIGKQPSTKRTSDHQQSSLPMLGGMGGTATSLPGSQTPSKGLPALGPTSHTTPNFMVSNANHKPSEVDAHNDGSSHPTSSHMSTKPTNGNLGSQLGYKKKAHKKSVLLSSLSANSFNSGEANNGTSMPTVSGTGLNHTPDVSKQSPSSSSMLESNNHPYTTNSSSSTPTPTIHTVKHKSTYSGLDPFGNAGRFGGLGGLTGNPYGRSSPTPTTNTGGGGHHTTTSNNSTGVYGHGLNTLQPLSTNNPYRTTHSKGGK